MRAEFLAECGSEPVGSAFVRVVETDLHGGVEPLEFCLDDLRVGAFLRAGGVVEDSDVGVADFAVQYRRKAVDAQVDDCWRGFCSSRFWLKRGINEFFNGGAVFSPVVCGGLFYFCGG